MVAVACGMADDNDGVRSVIDDKYSEHRMQSMFDGRRAMSEFEYINRHVVRNPSVKLPHHRH